MQSKILDEATFPELPGAVWELSYIPHTSRAESDNSEFQLTLIIEINGEEHRFFETVSHSWQSPSVSAIEGAANTCVDRYHVHVLETILMEGPVRFR